MPYIVTITTPRSASEVPPHMRAIPNALGEKVTRRPVATLEEAQEAVESLSPDASVLAYDDVSEQGGTFGPLPDGTVIEVRPTTYDFLALSAGYPVGTVLPAQPQIIDDVTEVWEKANA